MFAKTWMIKEYLFKLRLYIRWDWKEVDPELIFLVELGLEIRDENAHEAFQVGMDVVNLSREVFVDLSEEVTA